jgi:hypothetical protein
MQNVIFIEYVPFQFIETAVISGFYSRIWKKQSREFVYAILFGNGW